jgi:preprotein translocase subunit SecB
MDANNMETNETLIIHGQYIKDLSFENPNAPTSFQMEQEPAFEIGIDVNTAGVGENIYEVSLNLVVKALQDTQAIFIVELKYAGIFTVIMPSPEDLEKALLVQCASILFPFARRIISDVTRDGGYPPVSLHPVDFLGLFMQKKQSESEAPPANTNH